MRNVIISKRVQNKIASLRAFLIKEYKFSVEAADRRSRKMEEHVAKLRCPGDAALCRYRKWRESGYRCISFGGWVFAYLVVPEGVVVRDMMHGSLIDDVAY